MHFWGRLDPVFCFSVCWVCSIYLLIFCPFSNPLVKTVEIAYNLLILLCIQSTVYILSLIISGFYVHIELWNKLHRIEICIVLYLSRIMIMINWITEIHWSSRNRDHLLMAVSGTFMWLAGFKYNNWFLWFPVWCETSTYMTCLDPVSWFSSNWYLLSRVIFGLFDGDIKLICLSMFVCAYH